MRCWNRCWSIMDLGLDGGESEFPDSPLQSIFFNAGEFELVGRLILGDLAVSLLPGVWWSYIPMENRVLYPQPLLSQWTSWQMVGAMCHEAAEARYTGPEGSSHVAEWLRGLPVHELSRESADLLVKTVNDMRINRMYMRRYPGSRFLLRLLYDAEPEFHPKTDVSIPSGSHRPRHHIYLDGLTWLWVDSMWPGSSKASNCVGGVAQALTQTWEHVLNAVHCDEIGDMLGRLETDVIGVYAELVNTWDPEDPAENVSTMGASEVGGEFSDLADDDIDPEGSSLYTAAEQSGTGDDSVVQASLAETSASPRVTAETIGLSESGVGMAGVLKQGLPTQVEMDLVSPPSRALVEPFRKGAPERTDYTRFDYRIAVRALEDKIAETIEGNGRRVGLADLMDRRRYGGTEAFRRPRKQRFGDQGEIDTEHPERISSDPSIAFLKDCRVPREDRQRDFAGSILLDVSGSMIQKGYPTRKFDRLIETAIVFIEIHERLNIPYDVTAFSSDITSLIRFPKASSSSRFQSDRGYELRDHSAVFRAMYELDHKDTADAAALAASIENCSREKGLKSIIVITDGISSNVAELRRVLIDLDRKNRHGSEEQRMKVLAFGVGVAESEFYEAYQPTVNGRRLNSCYGVLVEDIEMLPMQVGDAIDQRIRYA